MAIAQQFFREHETEPLLGLPEMLPQGEVLLWQGQPASYAFAQHVFHIHKVAIWFCLIMGWRFISLTMGSSGKVDGVALFSLMLTPMLAFVVSVALLYALAALYARTTVYSITSKRVAIRSGLAVPITLNIPFSKIYSAATKTYRNGTGNIVLDVRQKPGVSARMSYVVLWPHVRPFHFLKPQPMFRCVPELEKVSALLREAVASEGSVSGNYATADSKYLQDQNMSPAVNQS